MQSCRYKIVFCLTIHSSLNYYGLPFYFNWQIVYLEKGSVMNNQTEEIWLDRKDAAKFTGTTAKNLSTIDSTKRHNLYPKMIDGKIHYSKSVLKQYRDRNLMPY